MRPPLVWSGLFEALCLFRSLYFVVILFLNLRILTTLLVLYSVLMNCNIYFYLDNFHRFPLCIFFFLPYIRFLFSLNMNKNILILVFLHTKRHLFLCRKSYFQRDIHCFCIFVSLIFHYF